MESGRGGADSGGPRLGYRADIDGLRAVAVLLVLASHMRTRVSGGFVGVDVFFVISGYLISAHVLTEMNAGRFSIVTFYERRVRRIFPALLVMMAVVSALVYHFFVPFELEAYGKSLLAALFSGSNFLFWHEAGYFDAPSALKPLLHTWSLGVEEQFYLLFPLLLLGLRRWFPGRLRVAVWGLAGVSFGAACVTVYTAREAAFFFAPLRAWELLAGTILSQHDLPVVRTAVGRNVAAGGGLAMIFTAGWFYTDLSPFPGALAVLPVLGAALVIAGGETGGSWAGRALSWRPVVFVGLISYSLYLWHWPLIVLQETSSVFFKGMILTVGEKLLVAGISLVVATLSWALVEQPFRTGRFRPGRRGVFWSNGVALTALAMFGVGMVGTRGVPQRFSAEAQRMADFGRADEHGPFRDGTCFLGPGYTFADYRQSFCLAETGKPALLIVGDSHAAQLWPGLSAVYGADHDLLQADVFSCRPFPLALQGGTAKPCRDMAKFLFDQYLPRHRTVTVVLSARWGPGSLEYLGRTIMVLKALGIKTIVVGPTVEYDTPQPRVIALALRAGEGAGIEGHEVPGLAALDRQMAAAARDDWGVAYISFYEDVCKGGCPVYAGDAPMLMDFDHLTPEASVMFARAMRRAGQL